MPAVLSWKPDMTSSDFFFCATVTLKPKKYFKRRRRETANLIRSRVMRWAMIWTLYNNSCCCVGVCSAGWSRWCLEFISLLTFFSLFIDRPALILPSLPRRSLSFFSLRLFPFLLKASLSLSLCSITSFHHRSLFLSLSHCVTCLRSLMCPDVKGEAIERDAARPHWAFLKSRVILGEDGETGLNVAATPELRTSLGWQM